MLATADSFRGLQNYTTLKHTSKIHLFELCFRGLQNYTTLKPKLNLRLKSNSGYHQV